MRNRTKWMIAAAVTALAWQASAVNVWWNNNGGDQVWTNADNWGGSAQGVPVAADIAYLSKTYSDRPVFTAGLDETVNAVILGVSDGTYAEMEMTGGQLTTVGTFYINHPGNALLKSKFDMSGGTLTVGGVFNVGENDNDAVFNMSGGLVDAEYGAMGDLSQAVLSNGTVDIRWNWTMDTNASLDIYDGTLIVRKTANESVIQGYIDGGQIVAYGGAGTVNMVNDSGVLTITAVPPPPPMGVFSWSNTDLRGDNFQSHNQKIVWTPNGLFRSGDQQTNAPSYDENENTIVQRSTDGGATWTTLFDTGIDQSVLRPVTVEADENANVYLIYPDPDAGTTRFVKFSPTNNYASAVVNRGYSQASSGAKFASFYDPGRQQLYHATQFGYLFTFDTDGNFVAGRQLFEKYEPEGPAYPHLFVDESGIIHYALTTHDDSDDVPYETIRYLKSLDDGVSWKAMDGTAVSIPTTCASNGPSTMINLPGEENYATWLACMHVKNGKAHFVYQVRNPSNPGAVGNPPTITNYMHYMRFDVATGVREIDRSPAWGGDTLAVNQYSASFASDLNNPTGALYAVGLDGAYLNALVSYDNGSTWEDFARSEAFTEGYVANPGLARQTTPDGAVVGCLATDRPGWGTVNFFTLYPLAAELPAESSVYDCESLTGSASPGTALDGQDGWVYQSGDTAPVVRNDLGGILSGASSNGIYAGWIQAQMSRTNNAGFSYTLSDGLPFGFSFKTRQYTFGSTWRESGFALGADADGDGDLQGSEIGPLVKFQNQDNGRIIVVPAALDNANAVTVVTNLGQNAVAIEIRLAVDPMANGGDGSGRVYYRTAGTANAWTDTFVSVNLHLSDMVDGYETPSHWNGMYLDLRVYEAADDLTVYSTPMESGYIGWTQFYGLSGSDSSMTADVENGGLGDGLVNLLEYALGGNPTIDDAAAVMPNGFMADGSGTNWLYYIHNERTDDASLTYTVGTKTDLVLDSTLDVGDVSAVGESGAVDSIKSVTNRTEVVEAAKFIGLEVEKN